MRMLLALFVTVAIGSAFGQEAGAIDKRIVELLVKESDAVIRCHKERSSGVGMDPRMKERYGMPEAELHFRLKLKETVVGEAIAPGNIHLVAHRTDGPIFLAEGDYLVFVRKSANRPSRWVLVADHFGLQPFAPELLELVKKVSNEKDL